MEDAPPINVQKIPYCKLTLSTELLMFITLLFLEGNLVITVPLVILNFLLLAIRDGAGLQDGPPIVSHFSNTLISELTVLRVFVPRLSIGGINDKTESLIPKRTPN